MKSINKNKRGFSLIEIIFYIAIFAIFSLVIIQTLVLMTKSFRTTQIQKDIVQGGEIMERIIREIKVATNINSITTNTINLRKDDDLGTAVGDTTEFVLNGNNINLLEDSVLIGNLNSSNVIVNNLTFTQITTTQGVAVKVYLSLSSTKDSTNKVYEFYDTAVLRGSY